MISTVTVAADFSSFLNLVQILKSFRIYYFSEDNWTPKFSDNIQAQLQTDSKHKILPSQHGAI